MPITTRPPPPITGNMHGMSAAFLCGEPGLDGLLGDEPRASITPDQLDLFGIRSIDPLEKELVRERRVAIADMRAIDEFGVGVLIRRVIERVKAGTACCMSASTSIFSIPRSRPASAPPCRAAPPIAKRI